MGDRPVVPAEPRRPASELVRETRVDPSLEGRGVAGHEDLQSRPPAVVGRALGVEAENIRPPAEQRGRMLGPGDELGDNLFVESLRELETGNESATQDDCRLPTSIWS
jgi:hypothetical protein